MNDLGELVRQTQNNPVNKNWYEKVEDDQCKNYLAWVACDHMDGKKANTASMARILFSHFNVKVSTSSIKTWLQKVEIGKVRYERPEKTS